MLAPDIALSDSNVEISINLNPKEPIIDIRKHLELKIAFRKLIKGTQIYLKRIKLIQGHSNISLKTLKTTNKIVFQDNRRTLFFEKKLEIERITYLDVGLSFSGDGVHTFGMIFEYIVSNNQRSNTREQNNKDNSKQGETTDSEEKELIVEGIKVVVYREPDLKISLNDMHNQEIQTIPLNLGDNEIRIDIINKNQNLSVYVVAVEQKIDTNDVILIKKDNTRQSTLIQPGYTYKEIRILKVKHPFSRSIIIKTTLKYKLLFNSNSKDLEKEKTITAKFQPIDTNSQAGIRTASEKDYKIAKSLMEEEIYPTNAKFENSQLEILAVPEDYKIAKSLMEKVIYATVNRKKCNVIIYSGISRPFLTKEVDKAYKEYMDTQIRMIRESNPKFLSYTRYIVLGLPLINLLNLALSENNNTVQNIVANERLKQKIKDFAEFLCYFIKLTYENPLGYKRENVKIFIPSDPFFRKMLSLMIVSIDDMDDVIIRFRMGNSEGLVIHIRGPNLYKKFNNLITNHFGKLGSARCLGESISSDIRKIDETLDMAKNTIINTYKLNMESELREKIEYIVTKIVDSIKEAIKKSCQSRGVH